MITNYLIYLINLPIKKALTQIFIVLLFFLTLLAFCKIIDFIKLKINTNIKHN